MTGYIQVVDVIVDVIVDIIVDVIVAKSRTVVNEITLGICGVMSCQFDACRAR